LPAGKRNKKDTHIRNLSHKPNIFLAKKFVPRKASTVEEPSWIVNNHMNRVSIKEDTKMTITSRQV
jgi:competence transcription factor ComK